MRYRRLYFWTEPKQAFHAENAVMNRSPTHLLIKQGNSINILFESTGRSRVGEYIGGHSLHRLTLRSPPIVYTT